MNANNDGRSRSNSTGDASEPPVHGDPVETEKEEIMEHSGQQQTTEENTVTATESSTNSYADPSHTVDREDSPDSSTLSMQSNKSTELPTTTNTSHDNDHQSMKKGNVSTNADQDREADDTGPIPGGSGIPEEEDQDNSGATTGNTSSKTSFNPPVSSNTGLTVKAWLDLQFHDNSNKIKKPDELGPMNEPPGSIDERILNRIQGSMIGMALGDALGAHVEFRPHDYLLLHPVTDLGEGGTWGLSKGQFTDDTSMALCLANSLIVNRGFNAYDQLVRYKWWHKYGYMSSTGQCFDIGAATKQSIDEFCRRQNKLSKEKGIPKGEIDFLSDSELLNSFPVNCSEEGVAGNGALMRLAPVPLFFHKDPKAAVEFSGFSGQITHGDTKAYDACRYYGALIVAALRSESKGELLSNQFYENHKEWFSGNDLHSDIESIAKGSYKKDGGYDDGIRGKGYIVSALEAALWAFWSTKNFEDGALAAVNLGDDTDTTAAIYGQLAGAYYGYDKLPKKWTKQVYAHDLLVCTGQWLCYLGSEYQCTDDEQDFISSGKSAIASSTIQQNTKKMLTATQSLYHDARSNHQIDLHEKSLLPDDLRLGQTLTPKTQFESTRLSTDYRTRTRPTHTNSQLDPKFFVNAGDYGYLSHASSVTSPRPTPWKPESSSLAMTNTNRSNTSHHNGPLGYPSTMTRISTQVPTSRRLERHSETSSTSIVYDEPSRTVTNTGLSGFDYSGTQRIGSIPSTIRSRDESEHSTNSSAKWKNTHGVSHFNLRSNGRTFHQTPTSYDMPSTTAASQYKYYKKN